MRHQAGNEMHIARETVELCDRNRTAQLTRLGERRRQLWPTIERVASLAGFDFDECGDDFKPFIVRKPRQRLALRPDAQPGPSLLACADADISDDRFHERLGGARSRPTARNSRPSPGPTFDLGKRGSSGPKPFRSRRKATHSTKTCRRSLPTGKNQVVKVFARFVRTSRASCSTSSFSMSICFSLKEMIARSRAPERSANAINARSRS